MSEIPAIIKISKSHGRYSVKTSLDHLFKTSTKVQISNIWANQSPSQNQKEITPVRQKEEKSPNVDIVIPEVKKEIAIETQKKEVKETNIEEKQTAEDFRLAFVLPSSAIWFEMNNIHEIEYNSLPEFFKGNSTVKTPEKYKEIRNFIIKLYRANPNSYLSATTCRRHVAFDVCSVMRIHSFLEHWGIINFNSNPYFKAHNISNNRYSIDPQKIILNPSTDTIPNMGNAQETKNAEQVITSLEQKKNLCTFCGIACGFAWYELKHKMQDTNINIRNMSYFLCINCFIAQNFPKFLDQNDFAIQFSDPLFNEQKNSENTWSKDEILMLLDSIEEFGTDWEKVSGKFSGKKNKTECILKFVSLPIHQSNNHKWQNINCSKPSDKPNIFTDLSNPIQLHIGIITKQLEKYAESPSHSKDISQLTEEQSIILRVKDKSIKRSKKLAAKSKKEIKRLVGSLLDLELKRLDVKIACLSELDNIFEKERQQMKEIQSQLFAERISLSLSKAETTNLQRKLSDPQRQASIHWDNKSSPIKPEPESFKQIK